jgi:hypothetical protein
MYRSKIVNSYGKRPGFRRKGENCYRRSLFLRHQLVSMGAARLGGETLAKMVKKSFDAPEEIRPIKRGKVEVVDLGRAQAMRVTFEPGWRWLEYVKPIVGTDIGTTFIGGIGGLETKRALSDAREYDRINQQPAFTDRRAP